MISYEIAKQLKEAGFPQEEFCGCEAYTKDKEIVIFNDGYWNDGDPEYKIPPLSELIEAVGKDGFVLGFVDDKTYNPAWIAEKKEIPINITSAEGFSPEEAVANLWLSLNKN